MKLKTILRLSWLFLGLIMFLAPQSFAGNRPSSQVVVEGGLAIPYGDLSDDFENTRLGFGASNGYELGFRLRLHLSQTFSISPSFHFVDFGNYNGVSEEVGDFRVPSSSLRYGVEFMVMSPYRSPGKLRPFLAAGVGLFRNRVQGFYHSYIQAIDESVSTFGVSVRGGVQIIGFEFSLVYNVNRFDTWHFYRSDVSEHYNWDSITARAGWIIPFQ